MDIAFTNVSGPGIFLIIIRMKNAIDDYFETRLDSRRLCAPLSVEDYVVQPWDVVSPPKWHLAHSSWFFERFILKKHLPGYKEFRPFYDFLFNSYYKTVGKHWQREKRGILSRPGVEEIYEYRDHVDRYMGELFCAGKPSMELLSLLEVGIHHEKQHQELLLMDIKAILFHDPELTPYMEDIRPQAEPLGSLSKGSLALSPGVYGFGAQSDGFSYDNERPWHKRMISAVKLEQSLVTNGEYLEFIADGGYKRPELWLSLGWDWLQKEEIEMPLYWQKKGENYLEYTLYGNGELEPNWPLHHVSFFEADAFARWRGCRLPSEFELELAERENTAKESGGESGGESENENLYHAIHPRNMRRQLWCWTQDQYRAYPGYESYQGSLGEYNKKFMCNQFVLRGGCFATPKKHYRPSYRNFYEPWQRWMFSGIRLANDA